MWQFSRGIVSPMQWAYSSFKLLWMALKLIRCIESVSNNCTFDQKFFKKKNRLVLVTFAKYSLNPLIQHYCLDFCSLNLTLIANKFIQEVTFKVQRQQNVSMRTSIQNDHPWKLQQIQDAANHLQQAIAHIDNVDKQYSFKTSDEVMHILGNILGCLQRSRTSLIVPKKKAIDDLIKSRNMVIMFLFLGWTIIYN